MPTRSVKPVALGTWSSRSRPAPSIDEHDFEPVEVMAGAGLGLDAALNQVRYRHDPRGEAHGGTAAARGARGNRHGARWSVEETGRAADTLLGAVAGYCLARDGWDRDAESALCAAVPGLAEPLRVLAAARAGLTGSFARLPSACALTTPVLAAARQAVALVGDRFRAVPPDRPMPWMDLRVTATQRGRALRGVVETYDELILRWYAFVFVEPPPAERDRRLADLRDALSVEAELTRCEHLHGRCRDLCAAEPVARAAARLLVRDLRAAVATLESAIYRACAR